MSTTPPTEYRRNVSFAEYNAENPDDPLNGIDVDSELDALGLRLNQLMRRLALVQRADGKLGNRTVHGGALSQEVIDFIVNFGGSGIFVPEEDEDGNVILPPGSGGSEGGSGVVFFRQLLDVPSTFSGSGGKWLRVNSSQTALEFANLPTTSVRWNDLTDASDLSETVANQFPRVNPAGNGLLFVSLPIDPAGSYARLDQGNDWNGNVQEDLVMGQYREKLVALGDIAGVVNINAGQGNHFTGNIVGDCVFTLSGLPPAGSCFSFTLRLTSPGSTYAHTWFTSGVVDWGPAGAPVLSAGGRHFLSFVVYPDGVIAAFNPR